MSGYAIFAFLSDANIVVKYQTCYILYNFFKIIFQQMKVFLIET